jgi:hypothetical protein
VLAQLLALAPCPRLGGWGSLGRPRPDRLRRGQYGRDDDAVLISEGRLMFEAAAEPKQCREYDCDHDIDDFVPAMVRPHCLFPPAAPSTKLSQAVWSARLRALVGWDIGELTQSPRLVGQFEQSEGAFSRERQGRGIGLELPASTDESSSVVNIMPAPHAIICAVVRHRVLQSITECGCAQSRRSVRGTPRAKVWRTSARLGDLYLCSGLLRCSSPRR